MKVFFSYFRFCRQRYFDSSLGFVNQDPGNGTSIVWKEFLQAYENVFNTWHCVRSITRRSTYAIQQRVQGAAEAASWLQRVRNVRGAADRQFPYVRIDASSNRILNVIANRLVCPYLAHCDRVQINRFNYSAN